MQEWARTAVPEGAEPDATRFEDVDAPEESDLESSATVETVLSVGHGRRMAEEPNALPAVEVSGRKETQASKKEEAAELDKEEELVEVPVEPEPAAASAAGHSSTWLRPKSKLQPPPRPEPPCQPPPEHLLRAVDQLNKALQEEDKQEEAELAKQKAETEGEDTKEALAKRHKAKEEDKKQAPPKDRKVKKQDDQNEALPKRHKVADPAEHKKKDEAKRQKADDKDSEEDY